MGEVWYNEDGLTNILSLAKLANKHLNRVTMDTAKEDAIYVHTPDKIIRFDCTSNNVYVIAPKTI